MADFNDILGANSIKEHLTNAIAMDKVSHAYIFNGEEGLGKLLVAKVFAKMLQCEAEENKPCNSCHSCIQAESGNQPDIIYVSHEKPNSIGVDDVRIGLVQDIAIKPYSSRYKVYIIDEAEKMTVQAQNAILKTIEEPPEYGVIIFITANADAFLPTILSRCVMLNFKPVRDEEVAKFVQRKCMVPDYQAKICAAFAQGIPGRAVRLAENGSFEELREKIIRLVKELKNMDIADLSAWIKELSQMGIDDNDFFDILAVWFRDVLLFKASNDPNALIFKESLNDIKKTAQSSSYEGIEIILNSLDKAKQRLKANVNRDLTMELLLLTIKEN